MRYFNCMLNTNSELIKANSKIRLNDYDYSGPIAALNKISEMDDMYATCSTVRCSSNRCGCLRRERTQAQSRRVNSSV